MGTDDSDHVRFNSQLPSKSEALPQEQAANVMLAIDVGSSSIRCTAYDCSIIATGSSLSSNQLTQRPSYTVLASYSHARKSIDPYSGHVRIFDNEDSNPPSSDNANGDSTKTSNLFDCIDICLDQVLQQLQAQTKNNQIQNMYY